MDKDASLLARSTVVPYAWVILLVVYLASVAAPLNQFKVPPIMPVLMDAFQINLAQAGAMMSVFALTGLVLALPTGLILQRLGPRLTGLIALGFLVAGAAIGALASDFVLLLAGRVMEGAGVGLIGVTAPATIAMWFPPEKQGAPMGIWATWVPVGTVAMYLLGPALTTTRGWQTVWWVGAAFALATMLLYGWFVRRPQALSQDEPAGRQALPLRRILANRDIWLLSAQFAFFNLALVAFGTYFPTFLSEIRGFPLGQAALVASIGTMVTLLSAPLAGWVSDRLGSRRLVFTLPYLAVTVFLLLGFHVEAKWIGVMMFAMGVFSGAIPTATFAAAPEVMRNPLWAGWGLAVILFGQNLGQLLGPLFFGQAVDALGWTAASWLLAPMCALGLLCGWLVKVR